MDNVASASINSFALGAPSSDLLERVLLELQALNDQVADLREENTNLKEEVQELRDKRDQDRVIIERQQLIIDLYIDPDPRVLDSSNEDCEQLRYAVKLHTKSAKEYGCEILNLDYRIKDLEGLKEPQPAQKDRGEILRALIATNGGKMLAKDARQKMRLDKATFSRLLDTQRDHIGTKPYHQDKRKLLLILK